MRKNLRRGQILCGETLDEAVMMAVDCLAGYLFWLKRDGAPYPPASAVNQIDLAAVAGDVEAEAEGEAFVNMITVDVEEYAKDHFEKSVRKTLTIPAWLNAAALERNINFSQALQAQIKKTGIL